MVVKMIDQQVESAEADVFDELRAAALAGDAPSSQLILMVDVLKEVVQQQKESSEIMNSECTAEPTATEYFAAITAALDSTDQSRVVQMLSLLLIVLPSTNRKVLVTTFSHVSEDLLRIMNTCLEEKRSEKEPAELSLQCLGILMAALEKQSWANPFPNRVLTNVLEQCGSPDYGCRNAAQTSVIMALESGKHSMEVKSTTMKMKTPARIVTDFCLAVLGSATSQDTKRLQLLLALVKRAAPLVSPVDCIALCLHVLELTSLGSPNLTTASIQCISCIVQSPDATLIPVNFLNKLILALLEVQPSNSDIAGSTAFCQAVASLLVRMYGSGNGDGADCSRKLLFTATVAIMKCLESSSLALHNTGCSCLNLIFQTVIDQSLISEMIKNSHQQPAEKPGTLQTVVQACNGLLQYKYQKAWSKILPLLGRLFLHLKGNAYPVLITTLQGLANLHDGLASIPSATSISGVISALNEAFGLAIRAIGIENFLSVLPLRPEGTAPYIGVPNSRAWVLPLLKEFGGQYPSKLAYFQKNIIEIGKICSQASRSGKLSAVDANTQNLKVEQIWGLFPAFCALPIDVSTTFERISPILAKAIEDTTYPGLLTEVCTGLNQLIVTCESRARKEEIDIISRTSTKFLPVLLTALKGHDDIPLAGEKVKIVCQLIGSFARVAPASFVSFLFKRLMKELLDITSSKKILSSTSKEMDIDASSQAEKLDYKKLLASNYMVASSYLTPSLDDECALLMYRSCKCFIRDESNVLLQKRGYGMLLNLCDSKGSLLASSDLLPDVLDLFVTSLSMCHVSARQNRLRGLTLLSQKFNPEAEYMNGAMSSLLVEAVLSTKDSNGKTRESAYELLLSLADHACKDPSEMVIAVVGCLGAQTAHMRSAAILALSRLQYEFGHFRSENRTETVVQMTPKLISTMLLLAKESNRETVRSVLAFLKIAIGGADRAILDELVTPIVTRLMTDIPKDIRLYLRKQMKAVLLKLCGKFGYERIKDIVPEEEKKLILSMQKVADKEIRQKSLKSENTMKSKKNVHSENDTSQEDEIERYSSIRDRFSSNSGLNRGYKSLPQYSFKDQVDSDSDSDEQIVDLLDQRMMSGLTMTNNNQSDTTDSEEGNEKITIRKDGKIIILDDRDNDSLSDELSMARNKRKRNTHQIDSDDDSDSYTRNSTVAEKLKKGIRLGKKSIEKVKKQQKIDKEMMAGPRGTGGWSKGKKSNKIGAEYRSKKARGDVLKKGQKLEPYAYIPLNAKTLLSSRTRPEAKNALMEEYSSVVRREKRGYIKRNGKK